MSEYELKDKGIKTDTETTSAISTISYEVENGLYNGLTNPQIKQQIEKLQYSGKFPSNLEYIDSFYDKNTSLSGVAFKDTTTGRVTIGFAGTNLDNGFIEKVKDLGADGSIAFNGPTDTADYFTQGHTFIQKMKNGYPVETITGHSKAGRDVVVLGVSNNIPNIVTYNPAPLTQEFLQTLTSFLNPLKLGERSFAQANMRQLLLNYKGSIVHLVSSKDWLTGVSDFGKAFYIGDRETFDNGKDHGVTGFLTKSEQALIRLALEKHTQIGGIGGAEMGMALTKQSLMELSLLRQQFMATGSGSLSSSQEIYLDASEARALTQGMKQTVQNKITEIKTMSQKAITDANQLWRETVTDAQDFGTKLSYSTQLEALEQGNVTENSMRIKPVAEYESDIHILQGIEENYNQLLVQIDKTITEQVAMDQELAQQLRGV